MPSKRVEGPGDGVDLPGSRQEKWDSSFSLVSYKQPREGNNSPILPQQEPDDDTTIVITYVLTQKYASIFQIVFGRLSKDGPELDEGEITMSLVYRGFWFQQGA